MSVIDIPLAQLSTNPHQPRKHFEQQSLQQLADSLRTTGVIQPVIVRHLADGQYQLIAGERRWRAAQLAGLTHLPALVREVDPPTQAQIALVENIHREDLNPIDRAAAYQALMEQLGLTQQELAQRIGEDRSSVANYLRLLDLAEPVRAMVRSGELSVGHGKILAGVADILEQRRLADMSVKQNLSVRQLESLIQAGSRAKKERPPLSAHYQQMEQNISRQLGLRVQLRPTGKAGHKGKLVLHYGSLEQFDQLVQRMGLRIEED